MYRRDFDYLQKYETLRSSSARPTAERSSDELLFLLSFLSRNYLLSTAGGGHLVSIYVFIIRSYSLSMYIFIHIYVSMYLCISIHV